MGDHRALIKIEASFHGITKKCNMWVNYFPTECEGVDQRVVEFFRQLHDEGMAKYNEEMAVWEEERTREQREAAEREQLKVLKAKYET